MQLGLTCRRDRQVSKLLPESPWKMRIRRFLHQPFVASQLVVCPCEVDLLFTFRWHIRKQTVKNRFLFVAQARSRFPNVTGVTIQAHTDSKHEYADSKCSSLAWCWTLTYKLCSEFAYPGSTHSSRRDMSRKFESKCVDLHEMIQSYTMELFLVTVKCHRDWLHTPLLDEPSDRIKENFLNIFFINV